MKGRWLTAIGAAFTLGSLYVAFRGIHLREVAHTLSQVGIGWAVPILAGTLLSIWIRAYRWKVMLQPIRSVGTGKTYSATMIGFMANNVLPMRLGEVVRAYSLGRSSGVSKSSAFATIVVERAFDLLAILLFLAVMLLKHSFATWVNVAGYLALGGCLGMFVAMGFFRWKKEGTLRVYRRLTARLPEKVARSGEGLLTRFLNGLEVLSRADRLLWVTLLSVATWLAMATGYYFTGLAFHLDLPFDASIVLVTVCALAVMLPSGPGFVGTFEVGARYGLMLYQIPETTALSYALFYHAVQFIPITLLGFYHLWRENLSLRGAVEGGESEFAATDPAP
jgi:glycosyltransferase 2 family protein